MKKKLTDPQLLGSEAVLIPSTVAPHLFVSPIPQRMPEREVVARFSREEAKEEAVRARMRLALVKSIAERLSYWCQKESEN